MEKNTRTAPRTDPVTPRVDTYTIKGGADVVWGVAEASTLGTVTDVKVDKEALHELVYNQQGAVNGVVVFDESTAVTLTVLAKASAEMPATGSSLTAGTVTGLVMQTSESHNYRGLKKFDVTVNTWTNLTLS